jgi:hypothetical protein
VFGGLKIATSEIEQLVVADEHIYSRTKTSSSPVVSTIDILFLIDKRGKAHRLISTKCAAGEVFSLNYIAKEMANFLQVPCKIFPPEAK